MPEMWKSDLSRNFEKLEKLILDSDPDQNQSQNVTYSSLAPST